MNAAEYIFAIAICGIAFALPSSSCIAQQVTGELGSPSATITISGKQLPPPDPQFGGVIKEKASESKPWWPPRIVPPKGAPNVLLIMTDDAGFGAPSTFGGVAATPSLDRIAHDGLRYTQFHSTSLCSPTRAALITGRNHHVAGFGVVGEAATGFPGYDSIIGKDTGTIGTILKENGYATAWFGKDHNTPFWAGPELGAGKHTIVFDFKFDGGGFGKGGTGVLSVDGKETDKKHMEHTTPVLFPEDEDFDVGMDTRTGVALLEYRYDCPFIFTGKIDKLTFDLGPPQYTDDDRKKLPAIADAVARAKD